MAKRQKAERLLRPSDAAGAVRSAPTTAAESRALELVGRDQGEALDPRVRAVVDPAFGHSFADVRVHAGPDASSTAEAVSAEAYTIGRDIVFNAGLYPPATLGGHRVLAHELAHVVQNESADSSGGRNQIVPLRSGTADPAEAEASRAAGAVVTGGRAAIRSAPGALIAAAPPGTATATAPAPSGGQEQDEEKNKLRDVVQGTPDSGERAAWSKQAIAQPTRAGSNERSMTGDLTSFSLGDEVRLRGGDDLKHFEADYAVFRLPAQLAIQSVGRVQDLLSAGGPREPQELTRASLKTLHHLDPGKNGTQLGLYMQWAQGTASLDEGMEQYLGIYQRLQGVTLRWRAMKEKILRKQLEARVKSDEKKLRQLEAPAKMIVEVLEVCEKASSVYTMFAPEAAEAEADVDVLEAATEVDTDIRTGSQKAATRTHHAKEFGEKSIKALGTAGVKFSKESVINFVLGRSDEIAGLEAHIALLKQQITDADEKAEEFEIEGTFAELKGTTREQRTAAVAVKSRRKMARFAAGAFAGSAAHGNVQANLAPLCAAAYQELSMFGGKAFDAYETVRQWIPGVRGFLGTSHSQGDAEFLKMDRRAGMMGTGSEIDIDNILGAIATLRDFGVNYIPQVKHWETIAKEWSNFFERRTGLSLDEFGDAEAEQQAGG